MAKKRKSVKGKKSKPNHDIQNDETVATGDSTAVADETELATEENENVAVEMPTETIEELVENAQVEIASEALDLNKESEANDTMEEEVAKDDTEEAELSKAIAEEDDPIEKARAKAEAEDDDCGEVDAEISSDVVEKAEETPTGEVGETPAVTSVVTSDDTAVDGTLPDADGEATLAEDNAGETPVTVDANEFNEAAPEMMIAAEILMDDAVDDSFGETAVTADEKGAEEEGTLTENIESVPSILFAPTDEEDTTVAIMVTEEESQPETKLEEPSVLPAPMDEEDAAAAPLITEEKSPPETKSEEPSILPVLTDELDSAEAPVDTEEDPPSEIMTNETPREETPMMPDDEEENAIATTKNDIVSEETPVSDVKVEDTLSTELETTIESKDAIEKVPEMAEAKAEVAVSEVEAPAKPHQTKEVVSEKPLKQEEKVEEKPTEAVKEELTKPAKKEASSDDAPAITSFFSLEELKSGVEGIAANSREQHLHPDEFEKVFGMPKEKFNEMRLWKRTESKKKVGLF